MLQASWSTDVLLDLHCGVRHHLGDRAGLPGDVWSPVLSNEESIWKRCVCAVWKGEGRGGK